MKHKISIIIGLLMALFFVSCTKTVVISDGVNNKKIKVVGNVEVVKESNNSSFTKFESVSGTKYSINNNNYTVSVK